MQLSHPSKQLWPEAGITKAALCGYYEAVADRMLPQLAGRPLTLLRHNKGVGAGGFLQKNLPDSAPDSISRCRVWTPSSNREVAYALADSVDDLRWMANQNVVELHHWLARCDRPERPDLLVWDLDPDPDGVPVTRAAWWLRELLDELGLEAAVKTSGKRGLHIVVPIERRYDYEEVRAFGLALARACAARHPDELTVQMRKAERRGRLLLDWSRNGGAQTIVGAWSPRASATATVSMPLEWDEVTEELDPAVFTIATAPDRPDTWARMLAPKRIEKAGRALTDAGFPLEDQSPRARTSD